MNAPDELAAVIYQLTTDNTFFDHEQLADAILAAGYVKPRTITTVEELAALPIGSVVLHNGRAFQHYPAYPAPFDEYQQWKCGDGGFVRSTKDGSSILPAAVLYEGVAA
jgi:hypothetical protein